MDTVEELNNTYYYAGRSNLTASQLLFMIFCENTANQLGVRDFGAIVAIVAGLNISPVSGKFANAIPNTSYASRGARCFLVTQGSLAEYDCLQWWEGTHLVN